MAREVRPLEAAVSALARRDRSAAGLTAYLEQRGITAAEAARAVVRLQEAGYVDDERFAAARAESLAGRGYGDEAIRVDLDLQGVERDCVAAALAALEPECERAYGLLAGAQDPLRTARRLAAKGFAADSIESARSATRR